VAEHIHLVSFLIHSPINHTVLSWADPKDDRLDTLSDIHKWQKLAQTLERGRFDGIFFADTPGVFDRYKDRMDEALRYGVCWPTHDPVPLLSALAAATTHLGLAATVSTGPHHPYALVRAISTVDYLSGGRVGWNIVTGHLRGEHRAYGLPELPHDERYDRAEEYMEVCYKLWDSVADGAILADKAAGVFADPDRIGKVEHDGKYFKCHTVSPCWPSPQRRPVLFQAGTSGRGQLFAFNHADVTFAIQPTLERMKIYMKGYHEAAKAAGVTAPPPVSFGLQPVLGGTEEEAKRTLADLIERMPLDACLARLSGTMGIDFSAFELDQPLQEMQTQASQGLMKAFAGNFGDRPFTLREVAQQWGLSVGIPQAVGTPEQVADRMETIWRETGCVGYNMTPTIMQSSVEDFVDQVVPILQKRGIYRTEYEGTTFRENLGLAG
jgi:FMN-dependent oxidoreductase (nitrilotriacetate monooxygenase family)